MPTMSRVEQAFCRSAPWRRFALHLVLPWALDGHHLAGDVLELGCGSGAMAEAAARRYPAVTITAVDIDQAMVRMAARRLNSVANASAQEADVTSLPFPANSFDTVTSFLMLHHVIDWPAALAEAHRVLRPGGLFVGYDLHQSRPAELVHIVDRSPYRLISHQTFVPALGDVGFVEPEVRLAIGGLVTKFVAHKPTARSDDTD